MEKFFFTIIYFFSLIVGLVVALFTSLFLLDVITSSITFNNALKIVGCAFLLFISTFIGGFVLVKTDNKDEIGDLCFQFTIYSEISLIVYKITNSVLDKFNPSVLMLIPVAASSSLHN